MNELLLAALALIALAGTLYLAHRLLRRDRAYRERDEEDMDI